MMTGRYDAWLAGLARLSSDYVTCAQLAAVVLFALYVSRWYFPANWQNRMQNVFTSLGWVGYVSFATAFILALV